MTRQQRYDAIVARFKEILPVAETELRFASPFQCLVAVILSAQCTDKRVNMITPPLFEAYPTAEAMAQAEPEEIYEYIKSCSYPNNKTRSLVGMSRKLAGEFGGEVPSDMDSLLSLPGVGRKTANVILSVVFGQSAMAVGHPRFPCERAVGADYRKQVAAGDRKDAYEASSARCSAPGASLADIARTVCLQSPDSTVPCM